MKKKQLLELLEVIQEEEKVPVISQYNLYGKRNDKGQIVISVVFTGNEEDIIDSILGSQIKEAVIKLKREIKK